VWWEGAPAALATEEFPARSYCAEVCDRIGECGAGSPDRCWKNPPPIMRSNETAWFVYTLLSSQWERSDWTGIRVRYDIGPAIQLLTALGVRDDLLIDTIEKIRLIEGATVELDVEAHRLREANANGAAEARR
jgi:hypothetical protein